jgi:GDP/UDP-N,N'-diacetylbacillosamine 2-epimerase (hydrolysing)
MPRKPSPAPPADQRRSSLSRKRPQLLLPKSAPPLAGEGGGEGLLPRSRIRPATRATSLQSRAICFVTGTRADFGLMQSTLRAIQAHANLRLQIIATGLHLDPAHGRTINQIRRDGFNIEATVAWKPAGNNLTLLAQETGGATARLAAAYAKLNADIILVVGDRVEAFAAATAAHLSGKILAHVHGGDRAQGQVDDTLRHAITKLAHIHFPATKQSAQRIAKLGEDKWRIHQVGSPGIDGITKDASPWSAHWPITLAQHRRKFALIVLHPTDADDALEYRRAKLLINACIDAGFPEIQGVYPNNDPGSAGIIRAIKEFSSDRAFFNDNLYRDDFLGLLRDAAVLVGNSSAGIIEAASFGTPVLDIGPRQAGRERGQNVTTVPFRQAAIRRALKQIWNDGHPRRYPKSNPYGAGNTAQRIAKTLATIAITPTLKKKLIAY